VIRTALENISHRMMEQQGAEYGWNYTQSESDGIAIQPQESISQGELRFC
jgi:hypothetical protein